MAPEIKNNERLWICKTPWCKNQIHPNDIVLAQKRIGEVLLRRVIGLPGSELKFSSEVMSNLLILILFGKMKLHL